MGTSQFDENHIQPHLAIESDAEKKHNYGNNMAERDTFYEKLYFHELDTREKLNARLPALLTFALALIAWATWLAPQYHTQQHTSYLIIAAFFLAVVSFGISCRWFWGAAKEYDYKLLPTIADIELEYTKGGDGKSSDRRVAHTIREKMSEAQVINSCLNSLRTRALGRCTVCLATTTLFLAIASAFVLWP